MTTNNLLNKIDSLEKILKELKKDVLQQPASNNNHLEALQHLLNSPDWPSAVDPDLLCNENNELDKIERAEGIRDIFIDESFENKKILDFGCGEGHLVQAITERNPIITVGYDYICSPKVKIKKDQGFITFDKDVVKENGPYDIIILYDVIDHLEDITIPECLKFLKEILADNGKIYIRAHPFISRHGGHTYNKINKAFAHLFLTENELRYLYPDIKNYPTNKIIYPVKTYREYIDQSGLTVHSVKVVNSDIEEFFKRREIAEIISKNNNFEAPIMQMSMQFVDFVLTNN
jgi:SAM-dependent methyltransferase